MNEPAKAADAVTSFPEGRTVFAKQRSAVKANAWIFSTSAKISDLSSVDFYPPRVCLFVCFISYAEMVRLLPKSDKICAQTQKKHNTNHKNVALLHLKGYQCKAASTCVCVNISADKTVGTDTV